MNAGKIAFLRLEKTRGSVAPSLLPPTRLIALLDKAIVALMTAIVLTLSWPVSMVLWHQSRSAREPTAFCRQTPTLRARSPDLRPHAQTA